MQGCTESTALTRTSGPGRLLWGGLLAAMVLASSPLAADVERTRKHDLRVNIITEGLDHPWGIAFLPDGRMLVTEREGRLRLVAADGTLDPRPISGLPDNVTATGWVRTRRETDRRLGLGQTKLLLLLWGSGAPHPFDRRLRWRR